MLQNPEYFKSPWGSGAVTSEGKYSAWGNAFVWCGTTCNNTAQAYRTVPKLVLPKPKPAWPPWLMAAVCSAPSPAPEAHPCPISKTRGAQATSWFPGQGMEKPPGGEQGWTTGIHVGRWIAPSPVPAAPLVPLLWLTGSEHDDKSVLLCSREAPGQQHGSFGVE